MTTLDAAPANAGVIPTGFIRRFLLLLIAAFLAYATAYFLHPYMPANTPPEGWFASWDQSQYRKAALNLTHWVFNNTTSYYPPLFPWLGAPFVRWWPDHTYFIPGFICLAVYLVGIAIIGERYFGRTPTYSVLAVMFLAFPKLTLEQWVIPWTSSGVGALSAVLFLLFDRDRMSGGTVGAFFLIYGAVFATRPFDVVPLFPLALAMAWRALFPLSRRALGTAALIGLSGLAFPVLYLGLNWHAEGDPFGGYLRVGREFGFIIGPQLVERAVSLWIDSAGIYGNPRGSLSAAFPLFIPALLLCAVSTWRAAATIRFIAIVVLLDLTIYVAFADLSPENMLPINVVHYFKAAMPWLVLIAVGQLAQWIKERAWGSLWATAFASVLLVSIRLQPVPVRSAAALFERDTLAISDPAPLHLDMIDVTGVHGTAYKIAIDGVVIHGVAAVRLLPMPWGTRFFFPRGFDGRLFSITFVEPFTKDRDIEVHGANYRLTSVLLF